MKGVKKIISIGLVCAILLPAAIAFARSASLTTIITITVKAVPQGNFGQEAKESGILDLAANLPMRNAYVREEKPNKSSSSTKRYTITERM